ncbi:MAG: hypothetical protein ABH869_04770, partial [Candidatus Omnitrophota bacterium]
KVSGVGIAPVFLLRLTTFFLAFESQTAYLTITDMFLWAKKPAAKQAPLLLNYFFIIHMNKYESKKNE